MSETYGVVSEKSGFNGNCEAVSDALCDDVVVFDAKSSQIAPSAASQLPLNSLLSDTTPYHFIGIGGIGMSGLARLLLSQNKTVTGSDIGFNSVIGDLIREGAIIYKGHSAENISGFPKVVFTSDIRPDNPEYRAALKMGCPLFHRADILAELLKEKRSLAVAGTHGKTTTSSLLATVLESAGEDPSFAIGGMLPGFQSNAREGKGDIFVFEADESDRTFLKYFPFGAIVTNIDNDHLINYEGNFALLKEGFKSFMSQVKSTKHLFWCRDDAHLFHFQISGQSYGFHPESDWKILLMKQEGFKLFFDLEHKGECYPQIELALAGRHNALNAAAVFGLATQLGISEDKIRQGLRSFQGVLRRCEPKGSCRDIYFFDDYAHHPTEIQTTLEGVRKAIGSKRLIAVFQPHRYSRTQDCWNLFGSTFNDADELIITDIFAAGEDQLPHITHALIQSEVEREGNVPCRYVPRSALGHFLSEFAKPHDVVVTLGAGDITKLSSETLVLLNCNG